MAVRFNNEVSYEGAVVGRKFHSWLDGMDSEYAIVWDAESKDFKEIQCGYYGIDGYNLSGGSYEIDVNIETAREIIRSMKENALNAFEKSVQTEKKAIKAGRTAEVVRGRKIPKGTILKVFWVGERETYHSRQYSWMNETEMIAGCYDENGNKVWIKAEYLENLTPIASPNRAERKKFIQNYVEKRLQFFTVLEVARG